MDIRDITEREVDNYLHFIDNSIAYNLYKNRKTIELVWILLGSKTTINNNDDNDYNNINYRCHEYPPIVDSLFNGVSDKYNILLNNTTNTTNTTNKKINQYVIRIDPIYKKSEAKYPSPDLLSDTLSENWKKCSIKNNNHIELSTRNNLFIATIEHYISEKMYDYLMENLLRLINKYKNLMLGTMDMTTLEFYRKYFTIEEFQNPRIWIGPSNCLANVSKRIYHPIIEINQNSQNHFIDLTDIEFENYDNLIDVYKSDITKYMISNWYNRFIEIKLKSLIDILKYMSLSDKIKDCDYSPEYLLSTSRKLLNESISHILRRLSGNYNKYYIKYIIHKWKSSSENMLETFIKLEILGIYQNIVKLFGKSKKYNTELQLNICEKENLTDYIGNTKISNLVKDLETLNEKHGLYI